MANPSRYRTIQFIGGRILEAREMLLLQSIAEGKDAAGNKVSANSQAQYRQGATLNIVGAVNGTTATFSAANPAFPMMVYLRDRWEVITPSDIGSINVGISTTVYVNYALRIVTSAEDPALIDTSTGAATANMGELDLTFGVDTSTNALNPATQLEKNTTPIQFWNFAVQNGVYTTVKSDNINSPALASPATSGFVKISTPTSDVAVAIDDPILNAPRAPITGSVVDSSVRVPVPVSGQTNADGSARYDLSKDPGGISSDKIIIQSVTERLTDYLANIVSQVTTVVSNLANHIGKKLGTAATHPMPTYIDVGAAPISHVNLPLGVIGSHPPLVTTNTGGFQVQQTTGAGIGSGQNNPAYGVFENGVLVSGLDHYGDITFRAGSGYVAAPGGTSPGYGAFWTGDLSTTERIAKVLAQHVNQNSHANPHGITLDDLGAAAYIANQFHETKISQNGYVTLPGGLSIQWGSTPTFDTGPITQPFIPGFANNCIFAMACCNFSSGGSRIVSVVGWTKTGVTIRNDGNGGANWLAIGY